MGLLDVIVGCLINVGEMSSEVHAHHGLADFNRTLLHGKRRVTIVGWVGLAVGHDVCRSA